MFVSSSAVYVESLEILIPCNSPIKRVSQFVHKHHLFRPVGSLGCGMRHVTIGYVMKHVTIGCVMRDVIIGCGMRHVTIGCGLRHMTFG